MASKRDSSRGAHPGDDIYNIRRREYRAAQRYLEKSKGLRGEAAAKNRAVARTHLERALQTYDVSQRQKVSAPIRQLANEFGIPVESIRPEFGMFDSSKRTAEAMTKRSALKKKLEEKSISALESTLKDNRAELEAQAMMENKSISKRIMGGLVDVWKDKVKKNVPVEENRAAMTKAIFEYFKTESWAQIIDILKRNVGDELFNVGEDLNIYDVVKISIQKGVTGNTLVA